jgi:hypothetical protein
MRLTGRKKHNIPKSFQRQTYLPVLNNLHDLQKGVYFNQKYSIGIDMILSF